MADIVMLIFKELIRHVVIFPDVFPVSTGFPFLILLELDVSGNLMLFRIQQIFLAEVPAVSGYFFQRFIKPLDFRFMFSLAIVNSISSPTAIRSRFFWGFTISSGEQSSIFMAVLFEIFLCLISFRFQFSSVTRRIFSMPSMTNICACPRAYFGSYSLSCKKCIIRCIEGVYGIQQTGKVVVRRPTPHKRMPIHIRLYFCAIDKKLFQCD